ncbi:MAG TPA: prephenate dehydrogenase/arogenate dehydrogenase family protein [Anaerolineales bacterium]|nr:prephenate dehydrogenase/arogenate dehydrogenase family protein [Anaerolineales bacterium]
MTVQITIIGTGQIGASIGLALGEHKDLFVRVGHDKDVRIANRAKDMGAFDRLAINLPSSVENASIVVLALPLDQIQETLKYIASDLQEEAVIMDTAPVKSEVIKWAKELLPPKRHYIGLTPVISAAYLETSGSGVEAARADLFKNGLIAILSPQGVPSEAIKLATDFSHLLGAEHLFMDPIELDSIMAATHILPQLIASTLLSITVDQPGWYEARKLAGRPYALVTSAAAQFGDANALSTQAMASNEHLVRLIDTLIENLYTLRQQLASKEVDQVIKALSHARSGREKWLAERTTANWAATETAPNITLPTAKDVFARMFTFGGGRKPKEPKKPNA